MTLGNLWKDAFFMRESLRKGHFVFANIHFLQFDVHTSIFGSLQFVLYMFEDIFCWHTDLVKILEVLGF